MNTLKKLRKQLNKSQETVANDLGIAKSTISKLENGDLNLTEKYISMFCDYYNVEPNELLGKAINSTISNYKIFTVEKIPVYSKLFGGSKILREEYFLRHEYAPRDVDLTNCVYLLYSDNAMTNAGILEGDLLLVKLMTSVDHNNIVVAAKNDDAGIVRRLMIAENQKILLADSNQPPIIFDDKWMVIGKVLKISRDVK